VERHGVARGRLATAVRAARKRHGWTRETLAHESGLSFAAITQIETGRRAEVRVSSLVSLADALDVSIDYLVRAEVTAPMLEHRAYLYDSPDRLTQIADRFAKDGLEAGNEVLIVASKPGAAAIRKSLGTDAKHVTFGESSEWFTMPVRTVERYTAFVRDSRNAGANWVDILGEPVWTGRSRAEIRTWTKFESMLNILCSPWPSSINCFYDAGTLPRQICASVDGTHPEVVTPEGAHVSAGYVQPIHYLTG
jgi:transcriptional regulator with XRE-family HTH domain